MAEEILMQCKCGSFTLIRRGKTNHGKGYRRHIEQGARGVSIDHSMEQCLKFTYGEQKFKAPQGPKVTWCSETRPFRMEKLA
jgi:hypothetical protein